ncbi:MAG: tryptophan synthase subunit alpha [Gemmatimonadota bacterium]
MSVTTSSDELTARFSELAKTGRKALVPYITAGHPSPAATLELMHGLELAGADVLELGVPFSDPMADGPVIQRSSQVALAAGVGFDECLELIARAGPNIPVVLFSYLNPVLAAGPDAIERAAEAGASGLLVTDLPVGADEGLEARLGGGKLALVRLVAPTTPTARMRQISRNGRGFVYLISRLGVTGARADVPVDLVDTVTRLRSATDLPICAGFGISTPTQAAAVAKIADGVVVGSAIVRAADESTDRAIELVRALRAAIDAA